jgi:hypothetical protein
MKIKLLLINALLVLCALSDVLAVAPIKAQVNKTNITTDEKINYKITIVVAEDKLDEPEIPEFAGFNVVSRLQSSTISFVKNNINTTLVYEFILAPVDVGKLKIEPIQVTIKGKTYSSQTFEIEVKQGKLMPQQKPSQAESEKPEEHTL